MHSSTSPGSRGGASNAPCGLESPPLAGPPIGTAWRAWTLPVAICGLLALTLAMFGNLFFSTRQTVLSLGGTDLTMQFVPWYEFGFGELRKGNLALWNPHLFSGLPFLGGFQSALLYPPNLVHLVLPIAVAVNLLIALHVLLCGIFTLLWARYRGLHPLACFVSASLLMFSGPYFLHIQAGHLPHLLTMAWAPLLFLAVDAYIATRRLEWCLGGMAVVALMILAGFPQVVFTTAVAAGVYASLRMVGTRGWLRIGGGLSAMFAGAAALTAVQLVTGVAAVAQSVRGRALPYEFAASISLPPESLITLLAPGFFGNAISASYWGRCFPWETTLFFGVTGLMLALYGAAAGDSAARRYLLPCFLGMLLLALGSHTPLFRLLYTVVPGFDRFRGHAKFIFPAALFAAMLAGVGFDRLLRAERRAPRPVALLALCGAVIAAGAAWSLSLSATGAPPSWWRKLLQTALESGESFLPQETFANPAFVHDAAAAAAAGLWLAAATLALLTALLLGARRGRPAAYAVAVVAVAEIFLFARASRATFELGAMRLPLVERVLKENPGDYRILNLINPNVAMTLGASDLWGYDHGVSLRYAEFMAFAQGRDPDTATQNAEFRGFKELYRMLRCRFIFLPQPGGAVLRDAGGHLPRLQLVQDFRVIRGRDRIFAALGEAFDPLRQVILESSPSPPPVPSLEKGAVRIVDEATDEITVEADVPSPAILVMTDGYDPGWRAVSLAGSVQSSYQLVPANYILRAVPLGAGHHRLRIEYRPRAFVVGIWITGAAALFYLLLAARCLRRRRSAAGPGESGPA